MLVVVMNRGGGDDWECCGAGWCAFLPCLFPCFMSACLPAFGSVEGRKEGAKGRNNVKDVRA